MSFFKVFDIAGQAMSAQSVRLNTTASNLANAESVSGSKETVYKSKQPIFEAVMNNAFNDFDLENIASAGVKGAGLTESNLPARMRYEPNNPLANEEGYVFLPNVNVIQEMANMVSASRSYQTNAEMFNTIKQLMQKTLTLGQ